MTATMTYPETSTQAPSMGRRIRGLWYRQSEQHGLFLAFNLGERRFRIYFPSQPFDDSPNADLWVKEGEKYQRKTGLWFRNTQRNSKYFFLSLREGNFRVYLNDRKLEDTQPDYTLYQYTDGQGNPVQNEQGVEEQGTEDYAQGLTF